MKATSGISAGIKTKNKHLAEFQNMKSGFNKRNDNLNKKINNIPKRSGLPSG